MDLTANDSGTIYAVLSGSDNVISVNQDGLVEAQGAGEDTIMISNSGQSTQVTVSVTITNHPPVLDSTHRRILRLPGLYPWGSYRKPPRIFFQKPFSGQ